MKARVFLPIAMMSAALLLIPPQARAGSVSGRILDASGKPVAGSKVSWYPFRNAEERLLDESRDSGAEPLGEATTDAEGRFRAAFEKPAAGVFLGITAPGLATAVVAGPFVPAEDTSLEDLELPAAKKLAGRVVDETGKPVPGAAVRASSVGSGDESTRPVAEGRSGPDGRFVLPDALDGVLGISVRVSGFSPFSTLVFERKAEEKLLLQRGGTIRGIVLDPAGKPAPGAIVVLAGQAASESNSQGAFSLAGVSAGSHGVEAFWKEEFAARASNIRIKKGETREVSLRLDRAATIAGVVLDEKTRKPLPGVTVSVSDQRFRLGSASSGRAARTDARGGFRIRGLAPRGYGLGARKEGYVPVLLSGVVAGLAQTSKVSIALSRAAVISGRVIDEKGASVAGARVRIPRGTGPTGLFRAVVSGAFYGRRDVATGPDGTFRLRNLAPGKNTSLEAAKTGYTTARRDGISLKSGESVKDVALVLRKGLVARGRVVDGEGKPVPGADVRVSPRDREGTMMRMVLRFAGDDERSPDATTGPDGSFVLAGLEEGEQSLSVSREGFAPKTVPALEVTADGENVWPPVILSPGVAVAGLVRDRAGAPIPGARIISFGESGSPRDVLSDPDGRFRLEGLSAGQPSMLNVTADGYASVQRTLTPPVEDLVLTLQTAGTIRGRAEDASTKKPVTSFSAGHRPQRLGTGGMQVRFAGQGAESFESTDGSFELTNVPPGKWAVFASAPGYRAAEISGLEIAEGETKEGIVLSLTRGGSVSGRVLDPIRGGGIPNASVSWQAAGSQARRGLEAAAMAAVGGDSTTTATDADGKFRFEGLPAGKIV